MEKKLGRTPKNKGDMRIGKSVTVSLSILPIIEEMHGSLTSYLDTKIASDKELQKHINITKTKK